MNKLRSLSTIAIVSTNTTTQSQKCLCSSSACTPLRSCFDASEYHIDILFMPALQLEHKTFWTAKVQAGSCSGRPCMSWHVGDSYGNREISKLCALKNPALLHAHPPNTKASGLKDTGRQLAVATLNNRLSRVEAVCASHFIQQFNS